MKIIVTILLLTNSCLSHLYAGTNTDSLLLHWKKNKTNADTLFKVVEYYKSRDLDSLKHYASILYLKANGTGNQQLITKTSLAKADSYLYFNINDSAEITLRKMEISPQDDPELYIRYIFSLTMALTRQKKNPDVLKLHYETIDSIKKYGQESYLPKIYIRIASSLVANGDLVNSTKYYHYALHVSKKQHDTNTQIQVYYGLTRIYNGAVTLNLDSAIYYGKLGLELAKETSNEFGYARMLEVYSAPLIRKGEFREGIKLSLEGLTYAKKYNFSTYSVYYLILNQGYAYEGLSKFDSARLKLKEAIAINLEGTDHHRLSYLINKSTHNYQAALHDHEKYWTQKESIIKSNNQRKLSSVQARYEANLKEKEVKELSQQAEVQLLQLSQQKSMLVGLVFLVIVSGLGTALIYRQRRLRQQQAITKLELIETKKRLSLEQQYRDSELKALRSQMNPHFVFNALNSIQQYIMLNEKKLAGKYLGKFADLMRTYLQHSQAKNITLAQEVGALELYLELEKLRFEEALECTVEVDDLLDIEMIDIPPFLVQPYVENSLKHGLLHKQTGRNLSIVFKQVEEQNTLRCIITDNGIGRVKSMEINKVRHPTHQSFATEATKNRLALLNKDRGQEISEEIVDLYDSDGIASGTQVLLTIPIERNQQISPVENREVLEDIKY